MRQRPSRTLWTTIDAVTNLVLTVAAIGVVYALVIGFAPGPTALVGEATRAYQPGDTVDESLAPYLSPNGPTLVAALQTTCKFCTDSMPFYRRLASQYEGRLHIVVVTPNSAAATAEYLSGHDLVPSTTVPESPIDGVTGTPTLLLVDDDGTISGTWRGRLNARGEEAVLVALDQAFGVQ